MLSKTVFANSRTTGAATLVIIDPEQEPAGSPGPRRFIPLRRTVLTGEVVAAVASMTLRQVFSFTTAECAHPVEAVYRFPLPGDGAVRAVTVHFGPVAIRAELRERQEAERTYAEAVAQGQQAALVTRESPDVFTLRVAGVPPDTEVVVETAWVQVARPTGVGWSLRLPLTPAPRFSREDERGAAHAQGQPLYSAIDPGHRFSVEVVLHGAIAAMSPTHQVAVTTPGDHRVVRLVGGAVVPDRDFELTWLPAQTDRLHLQVRLQPDGETGQVYFLAQVTPPAVGAATTGGIPREVILLVDRSGSMRGSKWQATRQSAGMYLRGLQPTDWFNLAVFANATGWLFPAPVAASAAHIAQAEAFLDNNAPQNDGTQLGVALEEALAQPKTAGPLARHLLLLTDAQVSDLGRVQRLADAESGQPNRWRISVVCIDSAPNSTLAHDLAERGGGRAWFLTSDPAAEDLATTLDEVLAECAAPVLTGLTLQVAGVPAESAGPYPVTATGALLLGDLTAGRSLWVVGRVSAKARQRLTFTLQAQDQSLATCRPARSSGSVAVGSAFKSIFGARRVFGLEALLHSGRQTTDLTAALGRLGYQPETVPGLTSAGTAVYYEHQQASTEGLLRALLVREALCYGLASMGTAFVAVRTEAGTEVPVQETVPIGNALPAGWDAPARAPVRFSGGTGAGASPMFAPATTPPPGRLQDWTAADMAAPLRWLPPADGKAAQPAPGLAAASAASGTGGPFPGPARQEPAAPPATLPPVAPPDTIVTVAQVRPVFATAGEELGVFDSLVSPGVLPPACVLLGLQAELEGAALAPQSQLTLLIYVEGAVFTRIPLADALARGWLLNLTRRPGQWVRLTLLDPTGEWLHRPDLLTVRLRLRQQ